MVKRRLRRWSIRWTKEGWLWSWGIRGGRILCTRKQELFDEATHAARINCAEGPISLRIYGKNGRIQEERTYPRSADPKRSRG